MSLLYYWHRDNYIRDLDMGAGYHLNQSNALMHELYPGQSLWAFKGNAAVRRISTTDHLTLTAVAKYLAHGLVRAFFLKRN